MLQLPSWKVVRPINDEFVPQLAEVYQRARPYFSAAGWKMVERSLVKGSFGGEHACSLLFQPATVLVWTGDPDLMLDVFDITAHVPWLHWTLLQPVKGYRCLVLRHLEFVKHPRAAEVRACAVFNPDCDGWAAPENAVVPDMPTRSGTLKYLDRNLDRWAALHGEAGVFDYKPPFKLHELHNYTATLHALAEMYVFGGSPAWDKVIVSARLTVAKAKLSYLLAQEAGGGNGDAPAS